jgi:rSAM/selenodomain-associated transferase 2
MDHRETPWLSVVIPVLNEAEGIGLLLEQLAPLRKRGAELILVDGGSSDGTREITAARVDRLLQRGRGRARQMNAGAAVARGEVLWFLHGDSRIPEEADEHIRGALSRRAWGRFDVRLSGDQPMLRVVERAMNLRSCLTGIATGDQGTFMGREDFQALGGFPSIELMEDIALSKRLKRALGRPACVRAHLITSSRRWETRGILRTIALMWWLRLAYVLGVKPERLARWYR